MSLVGDYAGSSSELSEGEDVPDTEPTGEPARKKKKGLPAADFDEAADFTLQVEEQERSVPTNFGGTFANKPRRNKGESGGKGKGKGKKGKGGGKGKDKLEGAGGPQGKAKTTSSGALTFDDDMTTKQRMQKRLTADPTRDTGVTQQKITNKHGEVKQIITITKRPDARPINHKRITMKDLFPKELSRC